MNVKATIFVCTTLTLKPFFMAIANYQLAAAFRRRNVSVTQSGIVPIEVGPHPLLKTSCVVRGLMIKRWFSLSTFNNLAYKAFHVKNPRQIIDG